MEKVTPFTNQKASPQKPASGQKQKTFENEIERIQALNDLAIDLKSNLYLDEKLQQVADKVRTLVNADITFICLLHRERDEHVIQTISGNGVAHLLGLRLPMLQKPTTEESLTDENVCLFPKSADQETTFHLFHETIDLNIEHGIAVPLQVKTRHLGFLFAGNRKEKDFSQTELCILSLIGNLLSAEIDRKRADEDQVRLETVLEQAAESIMITNDEGIIQYVNPAFEKISGYSREEAIGKAPQLVRSGKHDAAFYRDLKETLAQGNIWHGHFINKRKNGTLYELEATISPVKNEAGRITHFVSVRKDVTEEAALRMQLYQAQKMEAIGTLAGGIAHDFNNLLMGIQGNVSLMLFEMLAEHRNFNRCKAIENYVKKGSDLTKQLLGIAKGGKYQTIPTDLNQLVRSNLDMFGRTKKEIQIKTTLSSETCIVELDPGQMDQVLLNLFVNAWQAMPNGGQLDVKTDIIKLNSPQVQQAGLAPGSYVKITVSDTGVGIDKEIVERIFDPFFTTKDKNYGTGLGLASAYGIVKNHGGMITVRSDKGDGATFEIYLPCSQKSIQEKRIALDDITTGKGTILIVDDEEAILDIGRQMLERLNYKVLTASTGETAVRVYEIHHSEIDLVILDLIMPEMSGRDTYYRLAKIDSNVPVLLASGYALAGESREILKRGNSSFIQKPYNMSELSKAVSEILSKKI
jgi:PAS domain S-box-containing protein